MNNKKNISQFDKSYFLILCFIGLPLTGYIISHNILLGILLLLCHVPYLIKIIVNLNNDH